MFVFFSTGSLEESQAESFLTAVSCCFTLHPPARSRPAAAEEEIITSVITRGWNETGTEQQVPLECVFITDGIILVI